MRNVLLAAAVLLFVGCPSTVPDPPLTAPARTVRFVTPVPGDVENPVQFTVDAHEDIASVRYVADDFFTLGSSDDRDTGFLFGMDFAILGAHTMRAEGLDAEGDFVAEAEVDIDVLPDPSQLNELGTWLQADQLSADGYTHGAMAQRLADTGVKRVYLPVGVGVPDCDANPVLCDRDVTDGFRAVGVEPWAWMRAEASADSGDQAETIREAVPARYHGLVIDLGPGYDGDGDAVESLLSAMLFVRSQCDTTGLHLGGNFPLYLSTEETPFDHAIPLESMEDAVDGYLPRVSLTEATAAQRADPAAWATSLLCAWRAQGALKPVHHVFVPPGPTGSDAALLDALIGLSGREASLYSTPALGDEAAWDAFSGMDWWRGDFEPFDAADCPSR